MSEISFYFDRETDLDQAYKALEQNFGVNYIRKWNSNELYIGTEIGDFEEAVKICRAFGGQSK